MTLAVCPGCGLQAEPGGIPPDRPLNASPECWGLHAELVGFELNHAELYSTYHQLTVDAYGAQHAGPPTSNRHVIYSLAGLYCNLERGWSNVEVRDLHGRMGLDPNWPVFVRPSRMADLTVADVVAAGARKDSVPGHAEAVERWARSVWEAWSDQHEAIRRLSATLPGVGGAAAARAPATSARRRQVRG